MEALSAAAEAAIFDMSRETVIEWHTAFGTLSLDLARGALPAMGVGGFDEDALRSGLREQLEGYWDEGVTSLARSRRLVYGTFTDLSATLGEPFFDSFLRWGRTIWLADRGAQSQVFLWSRVVLGDGDDDGGPPPTPLVERLRGEISGRLPSPVFSAVPTTTWDRQYFQRYGYSLSAEPDADGPNPITRVREHVRYFQLVEAWKAAASVSVDLEGDAAAMLAWGRGAAPRVSVPADMLQRPGSWS